MPMQASGEELLVVLVWCALKILAEQGLKVPASCLSCIWRGHCSDAVNLVQVRPTLRNKARCIHASKKVYACLDVNKISRNRSRAE